MVGVEKVVFGTDFPVISPKKFIQSIKSLNLSQEVEEAIFSRNAEKLLTGEGVY
jgi:predicted TIM-barrel fold metal-dependent hydrolase